MLSKVRGVVSGERLGVDGWEAWSGFTQILIAIAEIELRKADSGDSCTVRVSHNLAIANQLG